MTRIGFALIALALAGLSLKGLGVIETEYADILPVLAAVAGAVAIAIDAERHEDPVKPPKAPTVPLGGGGRLGPITRLGFLIIAVGIVIIALRIGGAIDSEGADIAFVFAMVVGAIVVAIDGEREVRPD